MDDININLVKNNRYYIKSPFKGKILRLFVNENDDVGINDGVALLKTEKFYIEIECEYPGIVGNIIVNEDDTVNKWDTLMIVDVKKNYHEVNIYDFKVNSKNHNLIYNFQQKVLPQYFYCEKSFFQDVSQKREKLIFDLIQKYAQDLNMINPLDMEDLTVNINNIDGNDVVQLIWPDFESPLLALRTYFLIKSESGKCQYFTCEKSLEDELMISCIVENDGVLTRYNYGHAPDDVGLEKDRIIEIFE